MRTALCTMIGLFVLCFAVDAQAQQSVELSFLKGERWWAGVISQSHQMPITAKSDFEFDFRDNTAGNQAQPLLLSNRGRFVWCDGPFWFHFADGKVVPGPCQLDVNVPLGRLPWYRKRDLQSR